MPSGGAVECLLVAVRRGSTGDQRGTALGASGAEAEAGTARCVFEGAFGLHASRRECSSGGISRPPRRSGCGPTTARRRRRRSTRSATCRCRRTSSATIAPTIASAIRPCSRARADRSPRRPRACISRRRCSTALRRARRRASPRSRCTSATARSSRFASTRRGASARARALRDRRRGRGARSTARAPRAGASSPSARRRRGRSKRWRARTAGAIVAGAGDDRPVHLSRLRVPGRRRAADELPPAAVVAADAGVGVRRPRARAGRVSRGGRARLSLLQLRRRDADCLTHLTRSGIDRS